MRITVHKATHRGRVKDDGRMTKEEGLKASWDYWERQGLAHPQKRQVSHIKLLVPIKTRDRK